MKQFISDMCSMEKRATQRSLIKLLSFDDFRISSSCSSGTRSVKVQIDESKRRLLKPVKNGDEIELSCNPTCKVGWRLEY